jgi:GT2 family glycosyltransferase
MDAQQWRAEQRSVREAVRSRRRDFEQGVPGAAEAPPLASVIIVCWNAGKVLGRCLDQLFAQDHGNYEIIVVDDGSQDDTVEVAEAAQRRGELAIVRSPRNRGCPHARNLGLRHARGEIVAFIDADGFATPGWLRHVVAPFDQDETVGGVASTVFLDANPLVINGAGGIINRQGWAADLSMGESYESAQIASEALYPMGCGMALRRAAVERVGLFDDRMLNYYDDVDYGVRLWRAGFRVVVAPDAWVDHGFTPGGPDSARKRLLCERHRMRVVIKHASAGSLLRWAAHEVRGVTEATWTRRALKLKAMAWNMRHARSLMVARWRLRQASRLPARLLAPSWGDGFPVGVATLFSPRPETAGNSVDMGDDASDGQLIHGWFPLERVDGRARRWAAQHAALLLRLEAPARRMRIDFSHAPGDTGGVDLAIRRMSSTAPLETAWSTHLAWQYVARSVENHPVSLGPGDYELVLHARGGYSALPAEPRRLGCAVSKISLHERFDIAPDGVDMARPDVEEQLVSGWFGPEESAGHAYRWSSGHAAALVALAHNARTLRLRHRFAPVDTSVQVTISRPDNPVPLWSTSLTWSDAGWQESDFQLDLGPGEYMLTVHAGSPWSNPGQRDPSLWPENRTLGLALSCLTFGHAA